MAPKPLISAVAAALALGCGAAGSVAATAPHAQLTGIVCQRALDPPQRAVQVIAVMRPLAGTMKMRLKFVLLRRPAHGGGFAAVSGGDLGKWRSPPTPTLGQQQGDVWQLRKQVINLPAPATYRFRVTFRWIGSTGRILGTAVRTGAKCYQPELRPDLQVRSITVRAVTGKPTEDSYLVMIANAGASVAGPFEVEFADRGYDQTRTIGRMGRHSSRRLTFVGPVCTESSLPSVVVDPTRRVDDYNRANNSMSAVCPASGSAPSG